MRRTDREIKDMAEILEILGRCDCCRLGMCRDNIPYVVPVNFGIAQEEDGLILYIHGANAGQKLSILRENPTVCVEADCGHRLITGQQACQYTMEYESVIAFGVAQILTEPAQIQKGLDALMAHYGSAKHWQYEEKLLERMCILRIAIQQITGKRLKQ